jgi:murein DD-endopeptidase MepM/ murein hydrolase activator NlpD
VRGLSVVVIRHRRIWVFLCLCTVLHAFSTAALGTAAKPKAKAASLDVRWQPARIVNGSPIVFRIAPSEPMTSLAGKWLGHEVFFSLEAHSQVWYALAGASVETRPGKYALELKGITASGKELSLQRSISVGRGKYRSIAAKVPKQYTEPSAEQLREIDQDKALKERAFAHTTPGREWAGSFQPPAKAPISDGFGTARTFNGRVQSVHQGLDFATPQGTPVMALNSGSVLLAQPLFFEGGCIVLDHGEGLLTLYLHLSKIEVKEGDHITRGERIGLSGGTGRATGPHLHVAVRWQGVYLNPATLLGLKLP